MAEPYKKVGRGGAGNFYSKQDLVEAAKIEDIESASPSTASLSKVISASIPPPEYQHTGRGGAGNWVRPVELETQGLTQQESVSNPTSTAPNPAAVGVSKRVLGGSKPLYRGGRGGAGNYIDFEAEEKAKKEEEERVRREMERRVEADVEQGLSKPPRAYGGVGGAWEMGSMR